MATKEDADRAIERLHVLWLFGTKVSVAHAVRGDTEFSKECRRSQAWTAKEGVVSRDESKESVHGVRRSLYLQVEGVVDEAKREILNTCAVAWCTGEYRGASLVAELKQAGFDGCSVMRVAGAVVLLWFSTVDERKAMMERADLSKWFVKVEIWSPEVSVSNRSAWLSVVETDSLARVEETIELRLGDWSGKIRVQEVEVVHSHDVVCHCENSEMVAPSEVDPDLGVSMGGGSGQIRESTMGDWDEGAGLLDRELDWRVDRLDVIWCESALVNRGREVLAVQWPEQGGEGDERALTVFQGEWNSQQDKDFDFCNSNFNADSDRISAIRQSLTYNETDLVPVTVKPTVKEPEVEVVVASGVFRKVRSDNDLVLNTGSAEQKCILMKARGKVRRNKAKSTVGDRELFGNYSFSDSDFQARHAAILKEAEATARLGALIGVETVGREDEIIADLSHIIARHSEAK
ncbi:hypothetical protein V6N13_074403 [Hibiscus sabdariffa]